jgi:hypothetical protein
LCVCAPVLLTKSPWKKCNWSWKSPWNILEFFCPKSVRTLI